ncbi:MAG TPA: SurA N-terminal domain-containing protein [Alphaproteobacteria bacterium]|nr:SurA N-terminal domain-containing protein [Alphaproteobacteria bacterium]
MVHSGKHWRSLLFIMIAAALTASGCKKQVDGADVVARVNGVAILGSELDKVFKQQTAGAPLKLSAAEEEAIRLQLVQQLIARQVYLQKAAGLGLTATDDQVDARVNQEKQPYTNEEFAKILQDRGFTESEFRQELRRILTIDKLLQEISARAVASDAEVQSFYNEHQGEFNLPEPVYRLAHIFTTGRPVAGFEHNPNKARNDAEARRKIFAAHARLIAGADFSKVAELYSEDPDTASNGGQVSLRESQIQGPSTSPATRSAIARLKPGQFSDVIPVADVATKKAAGYRIVQLIAKEPAGQRALTDPAVQAQIRKHLQSQREAFLKAAYDEAARNGYVIHNYFAARIVKDAGLK